MHILALHGKAGAGKDTFADRLVDRHGFVKRAFADPLYEEVSLAFDVSVPWLRDRDRKETPQDLLRLARCRDVDFTRWARNAGHATLDMRSPRQILQWWGTEYRRAQDIDYWLKQAAVFAIACADTGAKGIVFPDCRYPNEARWIHEVRGRILQVVRDHKAPETGHASELPLPAYLLERTVYNTGSISYLHAVADYLIRNASRTAGRKYG